MLFKVYAIFLNKLNKKLNNKKSHKIGMLDAFLTSMFVVFLSEIADKTQLVIFALGMKYKKPWRVFAGALTAHAFMDGIAILIGAYSVITFPSNILSLVIGISFMALGLWGLLKKYLPRKKEEKKKAKLNFPFGAMLASFILITMSEMGDKSQIASGILAASFKEPLFVFLGSVSALAIAIGLNLFLGKKIAEKLPERTIKILTSLLFIAFGLVTLLLR